MLLAGPPWLGPVSAVRVRGAVPPVPVGISAGARFRRLGPRFGYGTARGPAVIRGPFPRIYCARPAETVFPLQVRGRAGRKIFLLDLVLSPCTSRRRSFSNPPSKFE